MVGLLGGTELIALDVLCKTAETLGHRKNRGFWSGARKLNEM